MRPPARTIRLEVTPPRGTATPLVLNSTANGLTRDTVGNFVAVGGAVATLNGVTSFTGTQTAATTIGTAEGTILGTIH